MAQMTILAGPERRRRWSDEQRERILSDAFQSGARICDLARRHHVAHSLIYQWRRTARRQAEPAFVSAVLLDEPPETVVEATPAIVLHLPDGGHQLPCST